MNKILILDDDPDFRSLLQTFLNSAFPEAEIILYDPVLSGIPDENYDWSEIDILLLDHFLCIKGYTGLDILRAHHEKPDFPATLMLTAATDEEIALKALNFGAYEFIRKQQLKKQELIESIKKAYSRYQEDSKKRLHQAQRKRAFNKGYFYKRLRLTVSHADASPTSIRALTLLFFSPVKSNKDIKQQMLLRDNIVKYAASISYTYFSRRDIEPSITLMSERCVAVLLDIEADAESLVERIEKFHEFHQKNCFSENQNLNHYVFSTAALIYAPDILPADRAVERLKYTLDAAEHQEHFFAESILSSDDLEQIEQAAIPAQPDDIQKQQDSVPQSEDSETEPDEPSVATAEEISENPPEIPDSKEESPSNPPKLFTLEDFDISLDTSNFSDEARSLMKAFEEKRFIQNYRNIISFSESEQSSENLFYTSVDMVDEEGNHIGFDDLFPDGPDVEVKQYLDRWMIKELAGCILYCQLQELNHSFVLRLSGSSLADLSLFDWLRELLTGLAQQQIGRQIILEISQDDFVHYEKQSLALVNFLAKNHHFSIAMCDITQVDQLPEQILQFPLDYLVCSLESMEKIAVLSLASIPDMNFTQYIKQERISIVCEGVENSMQLMEAIAKGADYAMGNFIGEASSELDSLVAIESMEI